jgi:hypothetical protein
MEVVLTIARIPAPQPARLQLHEVMGHSNYRTSITPGGARQARVHNVMPLAGGCAGIQPAVNRVFLLQTY